MPLDRFVKIRQKLLFPPNLLTSKPIKVHSQLHYYIGYF